MYNILVQIIKCIIILPFDGVKSILKDLQVDVEFMDSKRFDYDEALVQKETDIRVLNRN